MVLQVKVLINDRIDVALATGADGVHVGQDDIPADIARRLLGSSKILGVSVKTVAQAREAERAGADYLGAGASEASLMSQSCKLAHSRIKHIATPMQASVPSY